MRPEMKRDLRTFGIGAACGFVAGVLLVWLVMWQYGNVLRARSEGQRTDATPSAHRWQDGMGDSDGPPDGAEAEVARELKTRRLDVPVEGVKRDQLADSFRDARSGSRAHEAIDILAPRNTPVRAVEDGTIARLFNSKAGGITIYQFDPSERFCYYYAHLERYADGLREGDRVKKGQIVGYVGTSGNAPKDTPHLHFAVFRLTAEKHWWEGTPIDPYDILR
jgi:murein DD-endopeptidase MepM/ murein hydrolase activator NlpD